MKQLTWIIGITHKSHNDTNNAYNTKFSELMIDDQSQSDTITLTTRLIKSYLYKCTLLLYNKLYDYYC